MYRRNILHYTILLLHNGMASVKFIALIFNIALFAGVIQSTVVHMYVQT